MMCYRIEVYILGFMVGVYETNKHSEAKRIYWLHNNRLDRWTQLYIDGETGSKEWMDLSGRGAVSDRDDVPGEEKER